MTGLPQLVRAERSAATNATRAADGRRSLTRTIPVAAAIAAALVIAGTACARNASRNAAGMSNQLIGTGGQCVPVGERAGRAFGCYVLASRMVGQLDSVPFFWHIYRYADRAAADATQATGGTVVESLGSVWLMSIQRSEWRPPTGERIAVIGPLPVTAGPEYVAEYMEAVFQPGMKSAVHRHSGPEAWYTVSGETCLETPSGTMVGRAGGPPVIVPQGPPMELTATGSVTRRSLVLILHDASQPMISQAIDWTPRGLCSRRG